MNHLILHIFKRTKMKFPDLYIVTPTDLPSKKIKQTVNTAFGGEAVLSIRKCKSGFHKVKFDQNNEQRPFLWEEFYSDLTKYVSVWIDSAYLGDEIYINPYITYSTDPKEGYWELRLA
uniref:Uncharacterized protein n=1 Tax=viral metagenome TaxID=1070528 RepID=A0A6C0AHY5_9ZZZZ